jgi:hypothetical protein
MVSISIRVTFNYACTYVILSDSQKWYYIKRQEADEAFILKIYDSKYTSGQAEFTPHTGVDNLYGADGPEMPRESIEIRLVACYL